LFLSQWHQTSNFLTAHASYNQKSGIMKKGFITLVVGLITLSGFSQEKEKSGTLKVANTKITVTSSDSAAVGIVKEDSTKQFINGHIELGVNGYLSNNNTIALNKGDELMELNYGRSRYFAYYMMFDGMNIVKDKMFFLTGLGLSYNGYFFENNVNIGTANDTTLFTQDTLINYDKYKLRATYLQIPVMVRFRFHEPDEKGLNMTLGVIGGYRIGSKIKAKYTLDGDKKKDKIKDDFNFSPFKADATLRIGYSSFGLAFNYSLTSLFEKGKAPELYPFSIGITLGGGF
jgi:hypothetical protein